MTTQTQGSSGLRKATRQKAKIRLGLSAVAGGGKTMSAILIAKGLAKGDLSKVALIDTENGSGDLYAHIGPYNVLPLSAPFTPESYIKAIKDCEDAGMEVIIIDSITHEWDGKGGCLEIQSDLGGRYQDWKSVTPRHQAFINAILQSKCHIITTVRRKQDYDMTKTEGGKTVVAKVGLKEVTREGFEYEVTTNLELDQRHNASASKDRTGLFMGHPPFVPSEETGKKILDWCESGADVIAPLPATETNEATIAFSLNKLEESKDLKDLKFNWASIDAEVKKDPRVNLKKEQMKTKLTPVKA